MAKETLQQLLDRLPDNTQGLISEEDQRLNTTELYKAFNPAENDFNPAGTNLTSTNVDAAIKELDTSNAGKVAATSSGEWKYRSATTSTDPTSGYFNGNSLELNLINRIYINKSNLSGANVAEMLDLFSAGDKIYLQSSSTPLKSAIYSVDAVVFTTFYTLSVTYKSSGTGDLVAEDRISIVRAPSAGSGGDVSGPASATGDNFASFDGVTGKLIKDSAKKATDFATATQGGKADSALQPSNIGVDVQAHDAVLDATTASFLTAEKAKLGGIEALADVTDAANVAAAGAAMKTTGQTDWISGFWESPSDKSYTMTLKASRAGTITETTSISASGTCTATFKINTTALGGTANSVSSSESSQSHVSANTFAVGDDIIVTISANATSVDMALAIKFTYNLA